MTHLLVYEQAGGEKAKALAAIEVAGHKNSKRRAWDWAEIAIGHAEAAGIENAGYLVSDCERWPDTDELKKALLKLGEPLATLCPRCGEVIELALPLPAPMKKFREEQGRR